jgi:hypothetical protein
MSLKTDLIRAERLHRHRFIDPVGSQDAYVKLFGLLQPVSTATHARPGAPPDLGSRTTSIVRNWMDRLRADRVIVNGRFLHRSVGYVLSEDFSLYANAFSRPLPHLSNAQEVVLDAVIHQGPLTPRQIKEEAGLLNKKIMPALHRLQEAFVVYEDQVDDEWDRAWYDFSSEWPEIQVEESRWESCASEVLCRFLKGHVFATMENLRDWSGWPARRLATLIGQMETVGTIVPGSIGELGDGWTLPDDVSLEPRELDPTVFMLHRADTLVRAQRSELKRRFGGHEVLRYLLIDGEFLGAVVGHWRIGPYDVEDVVLEIPAHERTTRREEILRCVRDHYAQPHWKILRYDGRPVM